ncbi:MAG TPA: sigma-54 dependent transcriptional regulator [Holophagaceae bacterium]|jgi:DNA-binding NtrC family response regulator|nr:sigma-54 dependent transcriptional regulator [Holophagaceae bacterium]
MRSLPRLHWSTLGAPTEGCDSAWASQWEVSVDRAASPSLPPKETDLWVVSADGEWPPPELARLAPEVGALPILLVRKPGTVNAKSLTAWSDLGSVRWGLLTMDPPLPGLRPRSGHTTQLTASQALHYGLVAMSAPMQEVMQRARAAAATKATVLLLGESGTGKEVVARAVHRLSAEADGPFVPVHCGAIPENLLESELFGYTKGAFTDARKDTAGKFREAHGGTIFLDEVATMPLSAQVRLLRVMQEREVQPLGGGGPVKVDVRVVAATNADLRALMKEGRFREDLYYRLEVVPITLPPLRGRREEIPFLAQHFMTRKAREHGLYPKALHPSVDPLLMALPWPGNVRQLENAIERAIVLSAKRPVLVREDFAFLLEEGVPQEMAAVTASIPAAPFLPPAPSEDSAFDIGPDGLDLNQVVTDLEKKLMLQSLAVTRGNKKRAAELLGLKRTTFLEKMKRLDIQDEEAATD